MQKVVVIEVVQTDLFQSPAHICSYTRCVPGKELLSERNRLGPPVLTVPQTLAKSATGGRGVGENPPLADYYVPDFAKLDYENSRAAVHAAIPRLDGEAMWREYLYMVNHYLTLKSFE